MWKPLLKALLIGSPPWLLMAATNASAAAGMTWPIPAGWAVFACVGLGALGIALLRTKRVVRALFILAYALPVTTLVFVVMHDMPCVFRGQCG